MFYQEPAQMEQALRFGDVIQGIPICFPVISNLSLLETYHIQIASPTFSVVLSPCCSISDKVISVAPFIPLLGAFFNNPYFAEDPTRINGKVPSEKTLPPIAWEGMSPEEKAERLSKQDGYVFVEHFVYDRHPLFAVNVINRRDGNIKTNYYMIDFRTAIRIKCDKILNSQYSPGAAKALQLTVEARDLLRKKISAFYQRIPKEDDLMLNP